MEKAIYLVGGSVRDGMLGIKPTDFDYVAVGYSVQDFLDQDYQQVGADFPVFIHPHTKQEYALARKERKMGEGYMNFATEVNNVTLEEDLLRRDLTINSIAINTITHEISDPYNGQQDLEDGFLRHTSDAFCEDPVRVLRLARFRAKFPEFKIHRTTKVLVYGMREELKSLQPDRVWKEVEKALELENSHTFFETLFELGVLKEIFPHLYELTTLKEGNKHHREATVFEHTMRVLEQVSTESIAVKLGALFHDICKPESYRTYGDSSGHAESANVTRFILNDIQVPAKLLKSVVFMVNNHVKIYKMEEMSAKKIAKFLASFGKDVGLLKSVLTIGHADDKGRISLTEVKDIDDEKIHRAFVAIASYSPLEWIKANNNPSNEAIKNHVHQHNISCAKTVFKG